MKRAEIIAIEDSVRYSFSLPSRLSLIGRYLARYVPRATIAIAAYLSILSPL